MKADLANLADIEAADAFLDAVANGVPPILAGVEVGWTPAKTKQKLKDKDFAELVSIHLDMSIDSVERALHKAAIGGNLGAMQMILYNRRPEAWRDVKRIEVKTETRLEVAVVTATAKELALALMREAGAGSAQPGGVLDTTARELDSPA